MCDDWEHPLGTCDICNKAGLKRIEAHVCPCGCGAHIEGRYIGSDEAHRAYWVKWDAEHPWKGPPLNAEDISKALKEGLSAKRVGDLIYKDNPVLKHMR